MTDKPKQRRGFALVDPAKLHDIAVKGGESVKPENRSFHKDRSLAANAGAKGGRKSGEARKSQKETTRG